MLAQVEHDVVVLGTGAAGLVAALAAHDSGASVGLYEKAELVGGTTAYSGGLIWIPANPHQAAVGVEDSYEEGFAYLMSLSHGLLDERLVEALLRTGPEVVAWFGEATPLRLQVVPGFPDYQPEHPGGKPDGGRSLESLLFPFAELGEWAARVVRPNRPVNMMLHETPIGGASGIVDDETMAKRLERDERGIGQGIVGSLLKACLDRGIEPVTGARATRLLVEDERVAGVEIERGGATEHVRASGGVVLATGGFEYDTELVRSFLRGPMTAPTGVPSNTGDGLRMAMRAGAALGNMREAWWVPVAYVPDAESGEQRPMLILRERTLPRSVMVNRGGKRFVNEAANYNALGGAFHVFDAGRFDYPNIPCWVVFDHEYLRRYGVTGLPPTEEAPDWLPSAPSLEELAAAIGADPAALAATVAEFNADVAAGHDPVFGRGDSAYDLWAGDRSKEGRARTLGPVDTPPYYALELHSGCLGTSGGARTDEHGRVLDVDGGVMEGLYAAGNAMAGVTGMTYGGGGGTLGPAVVFGYIAGRHAAGAGLAAGPDATATAGSATR
jgi:3-oxosteroid 1-dehydrogenase